LNSGLQECCEVGELLGLAITEVDEMPSLVDTSVVDIVVNISVSCSDHIRVCVGARVIVQVPVCKNGEISISMSASILVIGFIVHCQTENEMPVSSVGTNPFPPT
jgi:hypothetical protein